MSLRSIMPMPPCVAATHRQDLGGYELHDLNTGDVLEVRDESSAPTPCRLRQGRRPPRLDQNTGAILTDTVVAPIEAYSARIRIT